MQIESKYPSLGQRRFGYFSLAYGCPSSATTTAPSPRLCWWALMWLWSPMRDRQTLPQLLQGNPPSSGATLLFCSWRLHCLRSRMRSFIFFSHFMAPSRHLARHPGRSAAYVSSESGGISNFLSIDFTWSMCRFFCPPALLEPIASSPYRIYFGRRSFSILMTWPIHLSCLLPSWLSRLSHSALR